MQARKPVDIYRPPMSPSTSSNQSTAPDDGNAVLCGTDAVGFERHDDLRERVADRAQRRQFALACGFVGHRRGDLNIPHRRASPRDEIDLSRGQRTDVNRPSATQQFHVYDALQLESGIDAREA